MRVNGLTGAQAYANLVTYANTVRALGIKLVICTVIARDLAGDPADLMNTRIPDYNTLLRANYASISDAFCDLAASPLFDTRADASNTTYYQTDKLHLTAAGEDAIEALITTAVTPLI
jgi:lysophospholipase L1-like esterase